MPPTHKALTPTGEWVEGWYYEHNLKSYIVYEDHSDNASTSYNQEALPETMCMATGRPGSNGKMMYEGDEITFEDTEIITSQSGTEYDPILNTGHIYWDSDECKFYVSDILAAYIIEVWVSAALTGKNIHDKPT